MKRERGYYWVRIRNGGNRLIASFDGKVWWISGSSTMWKESLFEKIIETPIPMPNELNEKK